MATRVNGVSLLTRDWGFIPRTMGTIRRQSENVDMLRGRLRAGSTHARMPRRPHEDMATKERMAARSLGFDGLPNAASVLSDIDAVCMLLEKALLGKGSPDTKGVPDQDECVSPSSLPPPPPPPRDEPPAMKPPVPSIATDSYNLLKQQGSSDAKNKKVTPPPLPPRPHESGLRRESIQRAMARNERDPIISSLLILQKIVHQPLWNDIVCTCPSKGCPLFALRMMTGSPILVKAFGPALRDKRPDARVLVLCIAWRMHLMAASLPVCDGYNVIRSGLDARPGIDRLTQICQQASMVRGGETQLLHTVYGMMAGRTRAVASKLIPDIDLYTINMVSAVPLQHAFSLLRTAAPRIRAAEMRNIYSLLVNRSSSIAIPRLLHALQGWQAYIVEFQTQTATDLVERGRLRFCGGWMWPGPAEISERRKSMVPTQTLRGAVESARGGGWRRARCDDAVTRSDKKNDQIHSMKAALLYAERFQDILLSWCMRTCNGFELASTIIRLLNTVHTSRVAPYRLALARGLFFRLLSRLASTRAQYLRAHLGSDEWEGLPAVLALLLSLVFWSPTKAYAQMKRGKAWERVRVMSAAKADLWIAPTDTPVSFAAHVQQGKHNRKAKTRKPSTPRRVSKLATGTLRAMGRFFGFKASRHRPTRSSGGVNPAVGPNVLCGDQEGEHLGRGRSASAASTPTLSSHGGASQNQHLTKHKPAPASTSSISTASKSGRSRDGSEAGSRDCSPRRSTRSASPSLKRQDENKGHLFVDRPLLQLAANLVSKLGLSCRFDASLYGSYDISVVRLVHDVGKLVRRILAEMDKNRESAKVLHSIRAALHVHRSTLSKLQRALPPASWGNGAQGSGAGRLVEATILASRLVLFRPDSKKPLRLFFRLTDERIVAAPEAKSAVGIGTAAGARNTTPCASYDIPLINVRRVQVCSPATRHDESSPPQRQFHVETRCNGVMTLEAPDARQAQRWVTFLSIAVENARFASPVGDCWRGLRVHATSARHDRFQSLGDLKSGLVRAANRATNRGVRPRVSTSENLPPVKSKAVLACVDCKKMFGLALRPLACEGRCSQACCHHCCVTYAVVGPVGSVHVKKSCYSCFVEQRRKLAHTTGIKCELKDIPFGPVQRIKLISDPRIDARDADSAVFSAGHHEERVLWVGPLIDKRLCALTDIAIYVFTKGWRKIKLRLALSAVERVRESKSSPPCLFFVSKGEPFSLPTICAGELAAAVRQVRDGGRRTRGATVENPSELLVKLREVVGESRRYVADAFGGEGAQSTPPSRSSA